MAEWNEDQLAKIGSTVKAWWSHRSAWLPIDSIRLTTYVNGECRIVVICSFLSGRQFRNSGVSQVK